MTIRRIPVVLILLFLVLPAAAQTPGETGEPFEDEPQEKEEKYNSGWSFYIDNDLVIGQDDDYTGGYALTLSGRRAVEYPWSLDPVLGGLNNLTGWSNLGSSDALTSHSFEVGATAFTPDDINDPDPIEDAHPYASLIFLNNTRKTLEPETGTTYLSTFSLGVLGTDAVGEVQNEIHEWTDSNEARGWDNQISDGGEPTARYTLTRQDLLFSDSNEEDLLRLDIKSTFGGSIGYVTQAKAGFNFRYGWITSDASTFAPDYAEYVNMGVPTTKESTTETFPHELFLWGGVQGRVRAYNAMLEGQFRDSAVTFDRGDLNSLIGEASVGLTCGFQNGFRLTLSVRGRTPEIDEGEAQRPIWGALIISQSY